MKSIQSINWDEKTNAEKAAFLCLVINQTITLKLTTKNAKRFSETAFFLLTKPDYWLILNQEKINGDMFDAEIALRQEGHLPS